MLTTIYTVFSFSSLVTKMDLWCTLTLRSKPGHDCIQSRHAKEFVSDLKHSRSRFSFQHLSLSPFPHV